MQAIQQENKHHVQTWRFISQLVAKTSSFIFGKSNF